MKTHFIQQVTSAHKFISLFVFINSAIPRIKGIHCQIFAAHKKMASHFTLGKYKIECNIPYNALHNLTQAILDHLDSYLLRFSYKLQGVLVSYEVEQYSQKNKIYPDSPFLFIDCIVSVLIFRVDIPVYAENGSVFGLLTCLDKHTGHILIKDVDENNIITKYIIPSKK